MGVVTSIGEELSPDISSYLLHAPGRSLIVDPGPDWHLAHHWEQIEASVERTDTLFVLILSPLPGCLSGLPRLATLTRRRAVIASWTTVASARDALRGWAVRPPGEAGGIVPLGDERRVTVVPPVGRCLPGALLAYDNESQTLFTGPFFGSIGVGRTTGRPILRRESVRAYTEAFTPGVSRDTVTKPFHTDLPVTRIAPAHGKPALGGRRLIETVFEIDRSAATVSSAFHRLYLRLAGLLGEEAAAGVYQAAAVPRPDLEQGYGALEPVPEPTTLWATLHEKMEQWLEASVLSTTRMAMARLSLETDLPLPGRLRQIAGSIEPPAPGGGERSPPVPATPIRVVADAEEDELTDPITGLLNEAVFRDRLGERVLEAQSDPVSVLLIGVDNIERINNRYGRTGGDDALHTVAYLLRNYQSARGPAGRHRIYKLNGPQFAYVLDQEPLTPATAIAEELRKTIGESAMFLEQITVSIGVVASEEFESRPGKAHGGDDRDARTLAHRILETAAARLRLARAGGMNTVCATDPESGSLVGGASVLVADPDAPYLQILTRQLNARGYSVLVAEDGEDALEIISQIAPDVIVCEAMLPKLNGFSIREELRHSSRLSEIPFILVSHRKSDELIEKAALLGIVHFLRKPFSIVELTGLLRNLSGGYSE